MNRSLLTAGAAALTLTSGACTADAPAGPPAATVRDSAGVTIVENPALSETSVLDWTIGEAPILDLGVVDGAPEYQFYQVQGAMRLDDGRILVANAGSGEIRVYDEAGTHLDSWGSQGQGPGEFLHTTSMSLWAGSDSLAVWDLRTSRLSLFAPDGSFARTQSFTGVGDVDRARSVWPLPNGHLVLMGLSFPDPEEMTGLIRVPEVFVVAQRDGTLAAPVGSFPGLETFMAFSGERLNIVRLPLARGNVAAQVAGGMVIGSNERFHLDFFGPGGGLTRSIRVDTPPRPVTDALLDAEVEARAGAMPEEAQPGYRTSMQEMPVPETMPVFDEVLEDPDGHLWVRLFTLPSEGRTPEWVVFDGSGQILGRVNTPDGLEIFQIGEDFILGSMEDELEVEHIQLWPLSR